MQCSIHNPTEFCKVKEKVVNKCLVICIGISKYKDGIPDVAEVAKDIEQYVKIFKDNFNYQVICNNYDELCSKEMLINCLTESYSPYLYDDDGNALFNGLIVTISGHCTDHSIICSDGKPLNYIEILSIFTDFWANKNLSINLPKFLWIDGKRGFNVKSLKIKEPTTTKDDHKVTYSSILRATSTTNSSVYSGQMAWNLCQIFDKHKDNKNLIFYDIIIELRQRLHQSIYQQYSFKFNHHDDGIDDVRFERNKTKATTRLRRTHSLAPLKKAPKPPQSPTDDVPTFNRAKSAKKAGNNEDDDEEEKAMPRKAPFFKRAQSAAPLKSAPMVPFGDTNAWGKKLEIVTEDADKTRVKVEWVFSDKKGKTHHAVMTHSQKNDTTVKASRAVYVNGDKLYQKKSTDNVIVEKYKGIVLKFNLEFVDNQWRYSLSINNVPFEKAYANWKLNQYAE